MPFLLLLFHSLLAIVAALPPPLSAANATSLQLPSATPTHPDIVTTRQVILAFVAFGQQIPENEALDTLGGAVQAIGDYVRAYPDQRITNDHFDFRRKSGNVLIAITTSMGEEITWSELLEILQTLRRYMAGVSAITDRHFQTLEFEIQTVLQGKIGYGLIEYFPPSANIA
ncbi:hypothetical protein MMC28_009583 [Mycoblastus sanguinarius]|nr:hypothetical protein [Mycoblastus sanguinarius]